MNYYKDNQNNVFAYSDIQTPKDGLTKITEQEALELTNPPPETEKDLADKIIELQDPYLKDQEVAKNTLLTAYISGNKDLELSAMSQFNNSISEMNRETSKLLEG